MLRGELNAGAMRRDEGGHHSHSLPRDIVLGRGGSRMPLRRGGVYCLNTAGTWFLPVSTFQTGVGMIGWLFGTGRNTFEVGCTVTVLRCEAARVLWQPWQDGGRSVAARRRASGCRFPPSSRAEEIEVEIKNVRGRDVPLRAVVTWPPCYVIL